MLVDLHQQYVDTGVIFVPRIIDAQTASRLRIIAEHCLCQWRLAEAARSIDENALAGAVVMRHLNDPAYFAGRREWLTLLLDIVADPQILAVVREVIGDEVLFRCTSLFMNPLGPSLDGNWHRDSQFSKSDPEAEKKWILHEAEKLKTSGRSNGIQLQIALVPSDDTEYVPGSHLRWDTEDENFLRLSSGTKHARSNLMPGAVRTHQEPGDAAAFHSFGLHRGRYHADKFRRTLMLTYTAFHGDHTKDYFSDQPWCLQPDYLEGVRPDTRKFFGRFVGVYRNFWTREKPSA